MTNEAEYLKRKAESQQMDPAVNRTFEANDYSRLTRNLYDRWRPNSPEVGHLVIRTESDGTEIAEQYDIPQEEEPENPEDDTQEVPRVRHLMHITAFQHATSPEGPAVLYYRAVTREGRCMIGTRANRINIVDTETGDVEEARVVYFSPERKKHFRGAAEEVPLFKENLSGQQLKLKEKLETAGPIIKGGRNLLIDPAAVKARVKMARVPRQRKVMGQRSAVDEYGRLLASEISKVLHPSMAEKLTKAIEADIEHAVESHLRPEWSHVHAFVLTHISEDPQVRENLVAAPRWFNTAMLVLECTAVWFSLHRPHALVHMRALFETLLSSHILKKGEYQISIEEKSRCIQLFESYDLSLKYAMLRKASDLAQMGAITNSLLGYAPPVSRYAIQGQTIAGPLPIINAMVITTKQMVAAAKSKDETDTLAQTDKPALFTPQYLSTIAFAKARAAAEKMAARKTTGDEAVTTDQSLKLPIKKNLFFHRQALAKKGQLSAVQRHRTVFDLIKRIRL